MRQTSPARSSTKQQRLASTVSLLPKLALVVSGVSLLLTLVLMSCAPRIRPTTSSISPTPSPAASMGHFVGGFSITTGDDAAAAAAAGVTTAFLYGSATPETVAALGAVDMRRIEAQPWSLLLEYECYRLSQMARSWAVCQNRLLIPTEKQLLADVAAYLRGVQHDPQVVGYWILDDWPTFDPGGATASLAAITRLVHELTPGRPTICGFGANLNPDHRGSFAAALAANYVPGACDMVALYIYSASVPYPGTGTSASSFDWSMNSVLPQVEHDLQQRDWDAGKVPLIGIAQAWGGVRADVPGLLEIVPTAADLEQQSASFCRHGAIGIVYYAWSGSSVLAMQTPSNNVQLAQGVRRGIAACRNIWMHST